MGSIPAGITLAINAGSSSIRIAAFNEDTLLRRDKLEHPAEPGETTTLTWLNQHLAGLAPSGLAPSAIAHRIVHGMARSEPARITPALVVELHHNIPYAPEHMPRQLALIAACTRQYPGVPQIACFDTAFHARMPRVATQLPLPRRLLAIAPEDPRAAEALNLFCYQVRKNIGALAAALSGLDTLVFARGIGENSSAIRARICNALQFLGLELDSCRIEKSEPVISARDSRVAVRVIPTDEETMLEGRQGAVTWFTFSRNGGHHGRATICPLARSTCKTTLSSASPSPLPTSNLASSATSISTESSRRTT